MHLGTGKVLVTGGAGFIGSELVRQLAARGFEVLAVDNLINGKRENLAGMRSGVKLIETDIRSDNMSEVLEGVDILFHLACLGVRHSIHSPIENHEVNAAGTLKLLLLARKLGIKRFVYVSSSEVYGTARQVPMTEDHPAFPNTVYGASKLAGERYAHAFNQTYGFPTVIIRPFNTYGPRCHHEGDSGEVIPRFLLRAKAGRPMVIFGDGTQTRDFTYVTDTAEGILRAGFEDRAVGQTINLGSGREITIRGLAEKIALLFQRSAQIIHDIQRPGDVLRLYADASKGRDLLKFSPKVDLRNGLQKLNDWYDSLNKTPEDLLEQETLFNWNVGSKP
jgi:UDP-glucose 4-epimerase